MADNNDWRQQLYDRYEFLRDGGFPSVGDGWRDIVENLCADIADEIKKSHIEAFTVRQIKEKFGGLRFYTAVLYGLGNNTGKIKKLVDDAELKSMVTCEACGNVGEIRTPMNMMYWLKCCCMKHYIRWPDNRY